jgi:hypothetical protein
MSVAVVLVVVLVVMMMMVVVMVMVVLVDVGASGRMTRRRCRLCASSLRSIVVGH